MSTEPMSAEALAQLAVTALENMKGIDIRVLDVRGHCNFTDFMVFSSGTSDRHLKSQANSVVEAVKAQGIRPMGVEGDQTPGTEWVLVDLVDVLVHIMLPETRDHYQLEKLWSGHPSADQSVAAVGSSIYASALEKIMEGKSPSAEFIDTDLNDDDLDDDEWDDSDLADSIDDDMDDDIPPRV
ncbi:MAG TPA: ribosome silencing factor [Halothiobacillus sp.]|nr:ribosome silencing factor [Halothiobacillus sp.]